MKIQVQVQVHLQVRMLQDVGSTIQIHPGPVQIQIQAHVEDSDPQPAKVQAIFLSPQHLPGQLTMWSNLIWCARVPQAPIVDHQALRFYCQLPDTVTVSFETSNHNHSNHNHNFTTCHAIAILQTGLWLIEQLSHLSPARLELGIWNFQRLPPPPPLVRPTSKTILKLHVWLRRYGYVKIGWVKWWLLPRGNHGVGLLPVY